MGVGLKLGLEIQALTQAHLQAIVLQPEQEAMREALDSGAFYASMSASPLPAYALLHEGEVMGCYGTFLLWQGRGMVWALLSRHAGRCMRAGCRIAKGYIGSLPLTRLEAYVRTDFKAGNQWVRLLGFTREGTMRRFFANGADAYMYARVHEVECAV